jgi:hypothetical protein
MRMLVPIDRPESPSSGICDGRFNRKMITTHRYSFGGQVSKHAFDRDGKRNPALAAKCRAEYARRSDGFLPCAWRPTCRVRHQWRGDALARAVDESSTVARAVP